MTFNICIIFLDMLRQSNVHHTSLLFFGSHQIYVNLAIHEGVCNREIENEGGNEDESYS